ncbi:MAG: penicillin-binding protein [Nocardioidaceae bacterium]|jgi:peptidoglycan glycosyltransferase|nr:penicillin-binding protein [Nocardioidaceae bacterium]
MNKPIRTLAVFSLVLFGLLLLNANYVQVFRAGSLDAMAGNKRARDAECARQRGPILVGGTAVARSLPSHDRLKYQRRYRQPLLYAPVTGYFSCYFGTRAVESSENSILSGSDSRLFVNRLLDLVSNNQPVGGSVLTTINAAAQAAAYNGLKSLPGQTRGAVVALDPRTGAILADVSVPSYNPNQIATHDFTKAEAVWKKLNAADAADFISRSTQSIYPPGSTFKMVTAATALSNGYTPSSMVRGGTDLPLPQTTHVIHNENGSDCGGSQITLTQALVVSCNVSFGDLGLKLGADKLRQQAERFGFNENYLTQLPFNASKFPSSVDEPETALSAIGQFDVAASPLQMAMVAAGIANGGAVMTPYVVAEVRSPDLDVLDKAQPQVLHQAISGSVADELTQMMVQVVNDPAGTGQAAQIPGVTVAGKTGTANSSASRSPYAWMVTFAPANDPQVAVAVVIERTGVGRADITGGGLGGPIARNVMEAVLQR